MHETHKNLLVKLERIRAEFSSHENFYHLHRRQEDRFYSYIRFLTHDDEAESGKSYSQRRTIARSRELLADLYGRLEPETFVLCTLALSRTTLGTVVVDGLISDICTWWLSRQHPKSLVKVTKELFASISSHGRAPSKRNISITKESSSSSTGASSCRLTLFTSPAQTIRSGLRLQRVQA